MLHYVCKTTEHLLRVIYYRFQGKRMILKTKKSCNNIMDAKLKVRGKEKTLRLIKDLFCKEEYVMTCHWILLQTRMNYLEICAGVLW